MGADEDIDLLAGGECDIDPYPRAEFAAKGARSAALSAQTSIT